MKSSYLQKKKLPDAPGVYFFKHRGQILYIGKATSLRDRVRSYFASDLIVTRGPFILDMITKATTLDYVQTDSVLEALVLEASLIKQHQPKYNTKEKDNRSFNYVVITDETYPAVKIVRGRNLQKDIASGTGQFAHIKDYFGPFPQSMALREALKIIRKIFPFHDTCVPALPEEAETRIVKGNIVCLRACFNYQIGLCPGVCIGKVSPKEYAKTIRHITLFFQGKKDILVKALEKEMKVYAKAQEFEKANATKRTLFALQHIKDVSLLKRESDFENSTDQEVMNMNSIDSHAHTLRIEAYDIAHISGTSMVGGLVVMEDGQFVKQAYRKFTIKSVKQANDIAALREVLTRRLAHTEWQLPHIVAIDGGQAQLALAEEVIGQFNAVNTAHITVVSVVKDDRHKARELLKSNVLKSINADIYKNDIIRLNEECHRYTIAFHRKVRSKKVRG